MSRYRQQLEDKHMSHLNIAFDIASECLLIVFPGNKLSNLLDAEVVLMMQDSLKILRAIVTVQSRRNSTAREQMKDYLKEGKK